MAQSAPPLTHGITFVTGKPGSGKSFYGVRQLLRTVARERRPVFTNLPINERVVKAYVGRRWGKELVGLIHPVSEDHLRAYFERLASRDVFIRKLRDAASDRGVKIPDWQAERYWYAWAGPDRLRRTGDEDANWIPPGSAMILDELHKWFPQSLQSKESKSILDYLSMHRHWFHHLWVLSQHMMQVSISFRRQSNKLVEVQNLSDAIPIPFVDLKKFGLSVFIYKWWDWDTFELPGNDPGRKPFRSAVVFPGLPWNRVIFRLYRSYTGCTSFRRLREAIGRGRAEAGLPSDGRTEKERDRMKKREARRRSVPVRVVLWFLRRGITLALLMLAFVLGQASGRMQPNGLVDEETGFLWGSLDGVSGRGAIVDGELVQVGELYKGEALLVAVNPRARASAWWVRDVGYAWTPGAGRPVRIGDADDIRGLAESRGIQLEPEASVADPVE